MKISDEAFVQAIWTYQLKSLSNGVLHRYVGEKYGVVNEDWFFNASGIHTCERSFITDKIGKQQAYKRIRLLIASKHIDWAHRKCTFFINTPQSMEAFNLAREFWLSSGVPTGTFDGRSQCVSLENHAELVCECFEFLKSKLGSVNWIELENKVAAQ